MSLIKESDVKNNLSLRSRAKTQVRAPLSQRKATSVSVAELHAIQANAMSFAQDFVGEHSSSRVALAQAISLPDSISPPAPFASRSVQP